MRPLDKALHSALVTVPLLYFESILGRNRIVSEYGSSFKNCCTGLSEKRRFFTDYGQGLLDELMDFSDSMESGSIGQIMSFDCGGANAI